MHVHKTAGNKSDNQSREGGKRMKEGKTAAERREIDREFTGMKIKPIILKALDDIADLHSITRTFLFT